MMQGSVRRRRWLLGAFTALSVLLPAEEAESQRRPHQSPRLPGRATRSADADVVRINYPDSVDLGAFVDYISQRLDVQIMYGDELRNQSVVFRPGQVDVPTAHLLDLLQSMLRMHDLALIESDVEGWLRIVQTTDIQRHVSEFRRGRMADAASPHRVVSQVVEISAADMQRIAQHLRSFLSSPRASVIEVPEKNLLIVTDYESAIRKALDLIELLDTPRPAAAIVTVPVQHQPADSVAAQVATAMTEKAKLEDREPPRIILQPGAGGDGILLIGQPEAVSAAKELIARFDVPTGTIRRTVAYRPRYITADRLLLLLEKVVMQEMARPEEINQFLDTQTNQLYVTAPQSVHDRVESLLQREDVSTVEPSRPVRIYKPRNRLARDLIRTLSEVLPNIKTTVVETPAPVPQRGQPRVPPGPNRPPSPTGHPPPMPTAQEPIEPVKTRGRQVSRVEGTDFVLSYDDHTNSIIAIGPREFHAKLQTLLDALDQRQPQVLIEMTLVAITFNDSFSLAIELASEEMPGDMQSLFFSAFGLSNIDLATGARVLNPGGGFNGVILGPHETPFIIRAIAAHGNSRIITTPKAVISDGTTASISSVEEEPFTSINASDTVATTSFAGFESAGTSLTVTPHIAQGDHLALDYSFNFSNFTGGGDVGVPPPRTTNTFSGTVEIPDGHTIVVGGLVTENETDSVTEVPLLGRIPVIGTLFQSSDRARTKSRVYALIKSTILRDDRFADLKLISRSEIDRASLMTRDYPESEYAWMR